MSGGLTGTKMMMSEEDFDAGMIFCGMLQDGCTQEEAVTNLLIMEYSAKTIQRVLVAYYKLDEQSKNNS